MPERRAPAARRTAKKPASKPVPGAAKKSAPRAARKSAPSPARKPVTTQGARGPGPPKAPAGRHVPRRPPSPRVARRRAVLGAIALLVVVAAFLVMFVYPTRTYLQQRRDADDAQRRLDAL